MAEKVNSINNQFKEAFLKSTIFHLFLDLTIIYSHYMNIQIKKIYGREDEIMHNSPLRDC